MLPALPILAAATVIALLAIAAWGLLQVRLQTVVRHRAPVRRVAVPLLLLGLLLPTVAQASPAPVPLRWRSSAVASGEGEISSGRASRERAPFGEDRTSGFRLFLQVDPSGYADSPNLYAGFANDPVNHRDPTGRCLEDLCVIEGMVALGVAEELADIVGFVSSAELCLDGVGYECLAAMVSLGDVATGPNPLGDIVQGVSIAKGNKQKQWERLVSKISGASNLDPDPPALVEKARRDATRAMRSDPDLAPPKGGLGPVMKGQQGEARSEAEAVRAGEVVRGRQVTVKLPSGEETKPDLITVTPSGKLKVREAKQGDGARLTTGQRELKEAIETGKPVVPSGKNARGAGFVPGQPVVIDEFEEDRY